MAVLALEVPSQRSSACSINSTSSELRASTAAMAQPTTPPPTTSTSTWSGSGDGLIGRRSRRIIAARWASRRTSASSLLILGSKVRAPVGLVGRRSASVPLPTRARAARPSAVACGDPNTSTGAWRRSAWRWQSSSERVRPPSTRQNPEFDAHVRAGGMGQQGHLRAEAFDNGSNEFVGTGRQPDALEAGSCLRCPMRGAQAREGRHTSRLVRSVCSAELDIELSGRSEQAGPHEPGAAPRRRRTPVHPDTRPSPCRSDGRRRRRAQPSTRPGCAPVLASRKAPVPKVHFASPAARQPSPTRAACWSTINAVTSRVGPNASVDPDHRRSRPPQRASPGRDRRSTPPRLTRSATRGRGCHCAKPSPRRSRSAR